MSDPTLRRAQPSFERDLLVELTNRWGKRVAVKKDDLDLDGHFDEAQPDFPAHLVPVLQLAEAAKLDADARARILSGAWISYNAKTAAIEDEIILPACRLMLADHVPVRRDDAAVAALHQTIIDEHYHILMCHNAVGVTRRRRDLHDLRFDPKGWSVVAHLTASTDGMSGFGRDIVQIAFALAAETTINGFLSTLSSAYDIQPMNRITVDSHRKDESGHAVVFRELVGSMYRELDRPDRELFKDALARGLAAFRSRDHQPWIDVARAGGLEVTLDQLTDAAAKVPGLPRDTGPLRILLTELDLVEEMSGLVAG